MGIEKRLEAMATHYGYPEDLIDPCGAARDALSTIRQLGSLVDKQKTAIAQARAEGERAGLERAAKEADEEADYSAKQISSFAPFSAGGNGEREMEIGARSAARQVAKRIRALKVEGE